MGGQEVVKQPQISHMLPLSLVLSGAEVDLVVIFWVCRRAKEIPDSPMKSSRSKGCQLPKKKYYYF